MSRPLFNWKGCDVLIVLVVIVAIIVVINVSSYGISCWLHDGKMSKNAILYAYSNMDVDTPLPKDRGFSVH